MTTSSRRAFLAMLAPAVALGACGRIRDSRLNPFNWFGRDREEKVETIETVQDGRPLVDQVISLKVDPTPEGAIIRAVGLPQTQGFWEAELVEIEDENLADAAFEFRIIPPPFNSRQGTQRSREVIVGATLSNARLNTIRSITVIARRNKRSVRR